MFIYVGKTFTAQVAGERLREVTCERCRTAFFYRLIRSATGTGSAPYYIGQASAQRRAAKAAAKALEKRLNRDMEMVSCPKCHWVNEDMVEAYQRTRYRQVFTVGSWLAIIGFCCLLIGLLNTRRDSEPIASALLLSAAVCAGLIFTSWWVRRHLRSRINPNLTYPRRPSLPPGTPPALTKQLDPATGGELLAPANPSTDDTVPQWIEFRPGELILPPVCCECLQPAKTVFATPFKVNQSSEMAIPMCGLCSSLVRRRWWLSAGKWLFLAPAAGVGAFLIPGIDEIGAWFLCVVASFVIFVTALILKGCQLRPYKLKTFDAERSIFGIHLKNRRYHVQVAECLRSKELVLLNEPRCEVQHGVSDESRTGGFPVLPTAAASANSRATQ